MEQWFKLAIEYAVPLFNTLLYVRNGHPLSSLEIELDRKQRQTELMRSYLGNGSQREPEKKDAKFPETVAALGLQYAKEIPALIQSLNSALQPNTLDGDEWRFRQEKALQQQLVTQSRETQLQLAAYQRETALKLPEVQQIFDSWPLRLFPAQILKSHTGEGPIPLRIFLAPPKVQYQQAEELVPGIPEIELRLAQGLREFLNQHYPLHSQISPTEFLGGAWDSKRFHSETSIKALFGMLKSEPCLVLESEIDGGTLNFRIAYWGLGQPDYFYDTILKLPYRQLVCDSARDRARKWKETRDKLLALGKNEAYLDKVGGKLYHNLKLLEEEEELQGAGIDTAHLTFPYQLDSKDFEALGKLLVASHCLVAGWMADAHHLAHGDSAPRLPQLLPDLLAETPDRHLLHGVMGAAVSSYQTVLKVMARERPYWVPEMALKLAVSLAELPDKSWARQLLDDSLSSWLELRRLQQPEGAIALAGSEPVLAAQDREYLLQLKDCFAALGDRESVARVSQLIGAIWKLSREPKLENVSLAHRLTGVSGRPVSVAISPDGQFLAAGGEENTIGVWPLSRAGLRQGAPVRVLAEHAGQVIALTMSPDGEFLACSDKTELRSCIYIWNLRTGELLRTLFGHKKSIHALALSPDGQLLASASHKIKIWNPHTGDSLRTLFGHKEWVYSLAFSPDGQTLASGSGDGTIKIWHPQSEQLRSTLSGHSGPVYSVAISPDGRFLVSGSADKTIKVWHAATGQLRSTLAGHSGPVYSVAISPDGRFAASCSADKTIKIWNLDTGVECTTLAGHSDAVYSVAISPDGQTLVSGSADRTVGIWMVH
ncbi:WD40 repeat domain-containing protein [Kamptonema formosum]|uniref:WD40 repeat domain-containing protein n=1 Tax=Kamptonema formosum TaxID=331992 RepID=UPI00034C6250|nr:WD40 repeat domain-containing protein [Oscillatoria sp. PCC 10802]